MVTSGFAYPVSAQVCYYRQVNYLHLRVRRRKTSPGGKKNNTSHAADFVALMLDQTGEKKNQPKFDSSSLRDTGK